METNSSGEDLLLKVRKPYTITKQRERWTENEHNRFLEALKLYGRAWQRIEEHVGTKTAVQIRSHAQKFFTKLEKEAVSKGANEIEIPIPPPRPKRKPTCPYPRKITNSKGVSVNFPSPLTVDFSNPMSSPPSCTDLNAPTTHQKHKNVVGSEETLTLFKDAIPCASISSVNIKSDKKTLKQIPTQTETKPPNGNEPDSDPNPEPVNQKEKVIIDEIQQDQPVQIPSPFLTNYPPFPPYLPNCHCTDNSDANYKSFITAFSNMLITNLLQNPALHAAARLAASYWTPPVETEMDAVNPNSMDASSVAALAAATVAAASSWWASQGLLPIYPPVYYNNNNNNNVSSEVINALSENNDGKGDNEGVKEAKSDCSDENMKEEIIADVNNNKINNNENNNNNDENNNDNNGKKKHDPSSCGSNTPSSSDVETDNITENLQNLQKGPNCDNEKTEGPFCNNNNIDNRRGRTSSSYLSMNDSWKEVSEEGRLAFQALFKRGVLPQSFSPPQKKFNGEERETEERENVNAELAVDLNVNADVINPFSAFQGLDLQKLKGRRTGFKPYKRCSVENINRGTAGEETAGNKRIRLEGETAAST